MKTYDLPAFWVSLTLLRQLYGRRAEAVIRTAFRSRYASEHATNLLIHRKQNAHKLRRARRWVRYAQRLDRRRDAREQRAEAAAARPTAGHPAELRPEFPARQRGVQTTRAKFENSAI